MTPDEVVHVIHAAFPVRPRPQANEITKAGDSYFERVAMRRGLKGRSWKTVSHDFIHRERSLIWLAPAGFGYYLPAWMCVACRDPEVRDSVLFALENYPRWIEDGIADERIDRLARPQLAAIVSFLEYWGAHADRIDAESPRAALPYWRSRLGAAR